MHDPQENKNVEHFSIFQENSIFFSFYGYLGIEHKWY
jgi:hypothetical protein